MFRQRVPIPVLDQSFLPPGLKNGIKEVSVHRAIGLVFLIFLSVAALVGIKVLDLPVLITILLVIPVTIFTLVSMFSLSVRKSPEASKPTSQARG